MFIEIEPYFEPIDIFEKIGERKTELTDDSLGFICGMIKRNRPKKIVEIGVSAGGTSCVILNCIEKLNIDAKLYSVDLAYTYHFDERRTCGFQLKDAEPYLSKYKQHMLLLGKTIAERIDEIMNDNQKIDLLILDTIHYLPGELWDFLVCMPFMSEKGCVICDDLLFGHEGENTQAIATKVLFDTVVADKCFLANKSYETLMGFQLNEHSWLYKSDYFSALFTPWWYYPSERQISAYRNIIENYYSINELKLFDKANEINKKTVFNQNNRAAEISKIFDVCEKNEKVIIYGAGKRGKALDFFLKKHGYNIVGYVISDDRSKDEFANLNKKIFHLSEINKNEYSILIAVADNEVRDNLTSRKLIAYDVPNYVFPFLKDYYRILNEESAPSVMLEIIDTLCK